MRITENMRFNAMVGNLFNNLTLNNDLTEKIASQKKVNRASDDPLSATKIVTMRQSKVAIEQYTKNIDSSQAWLSATESTLSGAFDLLGTASGIAVGAVGADASTRQIAAENIQAIIDSMRSLANTKWGDRYLFSGSREGVEPFPSTAAPSPATIYAAQSATDNTFAGDVASSGIYTGGANNTYAMKITTAGAFGVATYQISTDGGRTWGADTLTGAGVIDLGDGVSLTFNDYGGTKAFGKNDIFYVKADAPGYYKGNDENLSVTINRDTIFQYGISGAQAFTEGGGDVFETLNALKEALINNDGDEISAQRTNIDSAKEQILLCQSLCGMKANYLDVAKKNLAHFDETLSSLLSQEQDADTTELATKLLMSETALKASYAMAAKIGESSILKYL